MKIPTSSGSIESEFSDLKSTSGANDICLLFCHPHPLYGGNMYNNVINSLFNHFSSMKYSCLRFNFSSLNSKGCVNNELGGIQDCKDVIKYLINKNINSIILIGYSYGAAIGGAILNDFDELKGYCAISYPFTFIPQFISNSYTNKPKLFIIGDKDDFTTIEAFKEEFKKFPNPKLIKIFQNIDHFWREKNDVLKIIKEIEAWLDEITKLL